MVLTIQAYKQNIIQIMDYRIRSSYYETFYLFGNYICKLCAMLQTYDRTYIQKWLQAGNRTCPRTRQVLSHNILTPNYLIREMIEKWGRSQGIEFSKHVHYINNTEEAMIEPDHGHFLSLLDKVSSSSLSEQKAAAKELRILTKKIPSFLAFYRRVFTCHCQIAQTNMWESLCGKCSP